MSRTGSKFVEHCDVKSSRDTLSTATRTPATTPTLEKDALGSESSSGLTLEDATKGLSPWSNGYRSLYLRVALLTLVSTSVGYDGSLMSSINALESFQRYYGLGERGASSTGILFAIISVGQMAGAFLAWLIDWRGRRMAIFIGCFGTCLSIIVTATSPTFAGLVIARFFLAVFTTISTTATPMLLIEIAPPQYRATVSGLYNTLYYLGSIIAATTVYGTFNSTLTSGRLIEWRLPLWLQLVCPGIVCLGIYFVPESPRWLVSQSRDAEARAMLAHYHTPNSDATHPIVTLQLAEIAAALTSEQPSGLKSFFSPRETQRTLLSTPARRYRVALALAFSWFAQFSGNNVVSYYLPILARSVGIVSTATLLLLNVLYAATGWLFAILGAHLHDRLGRRRTFLTALAGMVMFLALAAAMAATYERRRHEGSVEGREAASRAAIAFIFTFGAVFAAGFTAMQPIYPAEVFALDQRAQGMALYQVTSGAASFVNTFAAPAALERVGWWVYVFFVVWDVLEFGVVYAWFVETGGETLEGLQGVFEARDPRRESVRRRKLKRRRRLQG